MKMNAVRNSKLPVNKNSPIMLAKNLYTRSLRALSWWIPFSNSPLSITAKIKLTRTPNPMIMNGIKMPSQISRNAAKAMRHSRETMIPVILKEDCVAIE
jgi:hypothetical protein